MALNHTVFVERRADGLLDLSASSPDEQAFVAAAYHFGFQFIKRDLESGTATIKLMESTGGREMTVMYKLSIYVHAIIICILYIYNIHKN